MNHSRTPGPIDRRRLDDLVHRSNAPQHPAIASFIDGGYRHISAALRGAAPPDRVVQCFLDELRSMRDYVGTSYRVSQIGPDGLAALQRGGRQDRHFFDPGVQSAFVLPANAAAWAARAAAACLRDGAYRLFSIFDESVPHKNLSTDRFADHVVVPPGTLLRLKALRLVATRSADGPGRARVVAHFARADQPCGAPYDLSSGAPRD